MIPPSQSHDSEAADPMHLFLVPSLQVYSGTTMAEKAETLIQSEPVVMFGESWCPFLKDAVEFLTQAMAIDTHVVHLDQLEKRDAKLIRDYLSRRDNYKMLPIIFIRAICIGGCQELIDRYSTGDLERYTLRGLFRRMRALHTEKMETAKLAPTYRGEAVSLPAWFPVHVNNDEVRLSAATLSVLSFASAGLIFSYSDSARWIVFVMAIDQLGCVLAGPSASPIGALATMMLARKKPKLVPGACKQCTSLIGLIFCTAACVGFFFGFVNTDPKKDGLVVVAAESSEGTSENGSIGAEGYAGCALIAWVGIMWAFEAMLGSRVGQGVMNLGFRAGILPDKLYRTYTFTRREEMDTWTYRFTSSQAPKPIHVQPSRSNPLALRYKKKLDDWSKDDFDPIRHMRVSYFAMPASIAGLALVFKIGASLNTSRIIPVSENSKTLVQIPDGWFQAFSSVSAFIFFFMMFLYFTKGLLFFGKVKKEWWCTRQSTSFSYIFISCILFGFLLYDDGDIGAERGEDSSVQVLGRVLYWLGAILHVVFCVMKMAEWICRRLDLEHVHADWSLLPIGLALAGFCTPIVGAIPHDQQHADGNAWLGRFYVAFSQVLFTPIYVITFYKALTWHNSEFRERHGLWLWSAAQCMLGLSDYTICEYDYSRRLEDSVLAIPGTEPLNPLICGDRPVRQVAGGVFLFLILCWASLPRSGFFFRDEFNMGYWTICFALNLLAAAATFFYTTNGWTIGLVAEMITIVLAAIAHVVVGLHTLTCLIRKHGICTAADKWGPLTIIRYTHSALRESLGTLEFYLSIVNLDDDSPESLDNLGIFTAHFNRFRIVHEEHTFHAQIVFSAIRELFPRRGKKCDEELRALDVSIQEYGAIINMIIDPEVALDQRKELVGSLQHDIPLFMRRYEEHLRIEGYDLLPVGEKYLSRALSVELVQEMWKVTQPERWEVIIDYHLKNLPRHTMRVRFLKILVWCMPERAQQIGAIVYRNVDAIMWDRLRCDVPALVPRGLPHWKQYN